MSREMENETTDQLENGTEIETNNELALDQLDELEVHDVQIELNEEELITAKELVENELIKEDLIAPELLWEARTGLDRDTLCGAIETIIFMNDRPVPITKIKNLIDEDIPLRIVHESLLRLQAEYENKHHGIRLMEVAEGYQFRTKATYSRFVQDIFKVNSLVLSPTALEVLAIIAYKQPVSKVEVDKIRGVDSGHIVRALMDKRLVKVSGRSEDVGRPVLYSTTQEFLEVFNLKDLAELPPEHELDEMSKASQVGKITDIKTIVHTGDKARFKFDELEELDVLSESIKNISAETEFTQSLKVEEKKRFNPEGGEVKSAFDLLEEFVNKRLLAEINKISSNSFLDTTSIDPKVVMSLEAGPFNLPLEGQTDVFVKKEVESILGQLKENSKNDFLDQEVLPEFAHLETLKSDFIDLQTAELSDDESFAIDDIDTAENEVEEIEEGELSFTHLSDEDEFFEVDLEEEIRQAKKVYADEDDEEYVDEAEIGHFHASDSNFDLKFDRETEEGEALSKALDEAFKNLTGEDLNADLSASEADEAHDRDLALELEARELSLENSTENAVKKAQDLDLDLSFLSENIKHFKDHLGEDS